MSRIDRNQVFDRDGNLISEEVVEVSDEQIELEGDHNRLRQLVDLARTPADEWTAAQTKAVVRLILRDKLKREILNQISNE